SGTQFDPALVELFCEEAPQLFAELDSAPSWELVIAAEPSLVRVLSEGGVDEVLAAVGEVAELESRGAVGHARGVADSAGRRSASPRFPPARRFCSAEPRSCTTSAALASRTRSGTSAARSAAPSSSGSVSTPT